MDLLASTWEKDELSDNYEYPPFLGKREYFTRPSSRKNKKSLDESSQTMKNMAIPPEKNLVSILLNNLQDQVKIEGLKEVKDFLTENLHLYNVLKDGLDQVSSFFEDVCPILALYEDPEIDEMVDLVVYIPSKYKECRSAYEGFWDSWILPNLKNMDGKLHFIRSPWLE